MQTVMRALGHNREYQPPDPRIQENRCNFGSGAVHPPTRTRMRNAASASWRTRTSWSAPSEFPWEKWTVFLHPAQRRIVENAYSGPARVSGSAGTGKTIVALHRAVQLARTHSDARVLLATFSDALANALRVRLGRLVHNQPSIAERLEVQSMSGIGRRLYETNFGAATLATENDVRELIDGASAKVGEHKFSPHFPVDRVEPGGRCVAA